MNRRVITMVGFIVVLVVLGAMKLKSNKKATQ